MNIEFIQRVITIMNQTYHSPHAYRDLFRALRTLRSSGVLSYREWEAILDQNEYLWAMEE